MLIFRRAVVIPRLHLQGTRTIIDSLDTGFEVTPILTSYGGVLDCLRTTVDEEGFSGLYKASLIKMKCIKKFVLKLIFYIKCVFRGLVL